MATGSAAPSVSSSPLPKCSRTRPLRAAGNPRRIVSLSGWCCSRAERSAMTSSAMPSTGSAWREGAVWGSWFQQTSAVSEDDITAALAAQWACPVFPLARERSFLRCATMLPMAVIQAARMLPVYMSRDRSSVYIAFVDGIDHSWLRSAEQMLGCTTVPCLVSESAFTRADAVRSSRWSAPRNSSSTASPKSAKCRGSRRVLPCSCRPNPSSWSDAASLPGLAFILKALRATSSFACPSPAKTAHALCQSSISAEPLKRRSVSPMYHPD